jgi:hypothetical protein
MGDAGVHVSITSANEEIREEKDDALSTQFKDFLDLKN